MKKKIVLLLFAGLIIISFSSCKKLRCKCVATGYVSQSTIDQVLDRHIDDCVKIADSGSPIVDDGVNVSCSY